MCQLSTTHIEADDGAGDLSDFKTFEILNRVEQRTETLGECVVLDKMITSLQRAAYRIRQTIRHRVEEEVSTTGSSAALTRCRR